MRSNGFVNSWAPSTAHPLPPGHTDSSWELALAAGATASAASAAPAPPARAKESKSKASKGKEEKGKTQETAPKAKTGKGETAPKETVAAGVATDSVEADLCKIDLRCGCIKEAGLAPDSEKLMMLQVDIGEEKPRQVLSGIAKFYTADQLMNRKVVVYCNIKPNKMAGLDSQAMILCATEGKGGDGAKVQLLVPPKGTKEGTRLTCGSLEVGSMAGEVNVKKISKVWERVQPLLTTNSSKQATFQGTLLQLDAEPITVDSIANGPIS
jgi:methionine--tRNA ligase beta chain